MIHVDHQVGQENNGENYFYLPFFIVTLGFVVRLSKTKENNFIKNGVAPLTILKFLPRDYSDAILAPHL
jgi:hypothetical protein